MEAINDVPVDETDKVRLQDHLWLHVRDEHVFDSNFLAERHAEAVAQTRRADKAIASLVSQRGASAATDADGPSDLRLMTGLVEPGTDARQKLISDLISQLVTTCTSGVSAFTLDLQKRLQVLQRMQDALGRQAVWEQMEEQMARHAALDRHVRSGGSPLIVKLCTTVFVNLIQDATTMTPDLCASTLKGLLGLLQDAGPAAFADQPSKVLDAITAWLTKLLLAKTTDNTTAALAMSTMLGLAIGSASQHRILEALKVLLIDQSRLESLNLPVLPFLHHIANHQAMLPMSGLDGTRKPVSWTFDLVGTETAAASADAGIAPHLAKKLTPYAALATDGSFLYVHDKHGLSKIGSGYHDTIQGKVYLRDAKFRPSEQAWLACVAGKLYYRSPDIDAAMLEISCDTLKKLRSIKPDPASHLSVEVAPKPDKPPAGAAAAAVVQSSSSQVVMVQTADGDAVPITVTTTITETPGAADGGSNDIAATGNGGAGSAATSPSSPIGHVATYPSATAAGGGMSRVQSRSNSVSGLGAANAAPANRSPLVSDGRYLYLIQQEKNTIKDNKIVHAFRVAVLDPLDDMALRRCQMIYSSTSSSAFASRFDPKYLSTGSFYTNGRVLMILLPPEDATSRWDDKGHWNHVSVVMDDVSSSMSTSGSKLALGRGVCYDYLNNVVWNFGQNGEVFRVAKIRNTSYSPKHRFPVPLSPSPKTSSSGSKRRLRFQASAEDILALPENTLPPLPNASGSDDGLRRQGTPHRPLDQASLAGRHVAVILLAHLDRVSREFTPNLLQSSLLSQQVPVLTKESVFELFGVDVDPRTFASLLQLLEHYAGVVTPTASGPARSAPMASAYVPVAALRILKANFNAVVRAHVDPEELGLAPEPTSDSPMSPRDASVPTRRRAATLRASRTAWLHVQRGGIPAKWNRRWLVLQQASLSFFTAPDDTDPEFTISLEMCRARPTRSNNSGPHPFGFHVADSSETIFLCAETESEMQEWLRVLQDAIFAATTEDARPITPSAILARYRTLLLRLITAMEAQRSKPGVLDHVIAAECWEALTFGLDLFFPTVKEQAHVLLGLLKEILRGKAKGRDHFPGIRSNSRTRELLQVFAASKSSSARKLLVQRLLQRMREYADISDLVIPKALIAELEEKRRADAAAKQAAADAAAAAAAEASSVPSRSSRRRKASSAAGSGGSRRRRRASSTASGGAADAKAPGSATDKLRAQSRSRSGSRTRRASTADAEVDSIAATLRETTADWEHRPTSPTSPQSSDGSTTKRSRKYSSVSVTGGVSMSLSNPSPLLATLIEYAHAEGMETIARVFSTGSLPVPADTSDASARACLGMAASPATGVAASVRALLVFQRDLIRRAGACEDPDDAPFIVLSWYATRLMERGADLLAEVERQLVAGSKGLFRKRPSRQMVLTASELVRNSLVGLPLRSLATSLVTFSVGQNNLALAVLPPLLKLVHRMDALNNLTPEVRQAEAAYVAGDSFPSNAPREVVVESTHPYEQNMDKETVVTIDGASALELVFDSRCYTESRQDSVQLFRAANQTDPIGEPYSDDSSNWPQHPVTVRGNTVAIHASTGDNPYMVPETFGWKITVRGVFDHKYKPPLPMYLDLQKTLSLLGGKLAGELVRGPEVGGEEREQHALLDSAVVAAGLERKYITANVMEKYEPVFPAGAEEKALLDSRIPADAYPDSTLEERIAFSSAFISGRAGAPTALITFMRRHVRTMAFAAHLQATMGVNSGVVDRAERAVIVALLKHQGLLGDAMRFATVLLDSEGDRAPPTPGAVGGASLADATATAGDGDDAADDAVAAVAAPVPPPRSGSVDAQDTARSHDLGVKPPEGMVRVWKWAAKIREFVIQKKQEIVQQQHPVADGETMARQVDLPQQNDDEIRAEICRDIEQRARFLLKLAPGDQTRAIQSLRAEHADVAMLRDLEPSEKGAIRHRLRDLENSKDVLMESLAAAIMSFVQSTARTSLLEGFIEARRVRATWRMYGFRAISGLLRAASLHSVKQDVLQFLGPALRASPFIKPPQAHHYMDNIGGIDLDLAARLRSAVHSLYLQLAQTLAVPSVDAATRIALLEPWGIQWRPSDQSFLQQSNIFTILAKQMMVTETEAAADTAVAGADRLQRLLRTSTWVTFRLLANLSFAQPTDSAVVASAPGATVSFDQIQSTIFDFLFQQLKYELDLLIKSDDEAERRSRRSSKASSTARRGSTASASGATPAANVFDDEFSFDMMALLYNLCGNEAALNYVARTEFMRLLMSILRRGTPRTQRLVVRVLRRVLPTMSVETASRAVCEDNRSRRLWTLVHDLGDLLGQLLAIDCSQPEAVRSSAASQVGVSMLQAVDGGLGSLFSDASEDQCPAMTVRWRSGQASHALADELVQLLRLLRATHGWGDTVHGWLAYCVYKLPSVLGKPKNPRAVMFQTPPGSRRGSQDWSGLEMQPPVAPTNRSPSLSSFSFHSDSSFGSLLSASPRKGQPRMGAADKVLQAAAAVMVLGGGQPMMRVGAAVEARDDDDKVAGVRDTGTVVEFARGADQVKVVWRLADDKTPTLFDSAELHPVPEIEPDMHAVVLSEFLVPSLCHVIQSLSMPATTSRFSKGHVPEGSALHSFIAHGMISAMAVMMQSHWNSAMFLRAGGSDLVPELTTLATAPSSPHDLITLAHLHAKAQRIAELVSEQGMWITAPSSDKLTAGSHYDPITTVAQIVPYFPFLELNLLLPISLYLGASDAATKENATVTGEDLRTLEYTGRAKSTTDTAIVRGNVVIPESLPLYYFEITVEDEGAGGEFAIGIFPPGQQLYGMPGWFNGSYGYHSSGERFSHKMSGAGKDYGGTFSTGDVVGCCWDRRTKQVFFTKNGEKMSVAFKKVIGSFFPVIGAHSKGGRCKVNFGQQAFAFDVRGYLEGKTVPIRRGEEVATVRVDYDPAAAAATAATAASGDVPAAGDLDAQRLLVAQQLHGELGYPVRVCVRALEISNDDAVAAVAWMSVNGDTISLDSEDHTAVEDGVDVPSIPPVTGAPAGIAAEAGSQGGQHHHADVADDGDDDGTVSMTSAAAAAASATAGEVGVGDDDDDDEGNEVPDAIGGPDDESSDDDDAPDDMFWFFGAQPKKRKKKDSPVLRPEEILPGTLVTIVDAASLPIQNPMRSLPPVLTCRGFNAASKRVYVEVYDVEVAMLVRFWVPLDQLRKPDKVVSDVASEVGVRSGAPLLRAFDDALAQLTTRFARRALFALLARWPDAIPFQLYPLGNADGFVKILKLTANEVVRSRAAKFDMGGTLDLFVDDPSRLHSDPSVNALVPRLQDLLRGCASADGPSPRETMPIPTLATSPALHRRDHTTLGAWLADECLRMMRGRVYVDSACWILDFLMDLGPEVIPGIYTAQMYDVLVAHMKRSEGATLVRMCRTLTRLLTYWMLFYVPGEFGAVMGDRQREVIKPMVPDIRKLKKLLGPMDRRFRFESSRRSVMTPAMTALVELLLAIHRIDEHVEREIKFDELRRKLPDVEIPRDEFEAIDFGASSEEQSWFDSVFDCSGIIWTLYSGQAPDPKSMAQSYLEFQERTTLMRESAHPYGSQRIKGGISIPGSKYIMLIFDQKCFVDDSDTLKLGTKDNGDSDIGSFRNKFGGNKFAFYGEKLFYNFTPTMLSNTHDNVSCDACGMYPMRGVRYKCVNCDNYDLCEECEANQGTYHDPTHIMFKIVRPPTSGGFGAFPMLPTQETDLESDLHIGTRCAKCKMAPIKGTRYKCAQDEDFDLCEACEELRTDGDGFHHREHVVMKIRYPKKEAKITAFSPIQHLYPESSRWGFRFHALGELTVTAKLKLLDKRKTEIRQAITDASGWSHQEDVALMAFLARVTHKSGFSPLVLTPDDIKRYRNELPSFVEITNKTDGELCARYALVRFLNMRVTTAFLQTVDLTTHRINWTLGHQFAHVRQMIFPHVKTDMLQATLMRTASYQRPNLKLNRTREAHEGESGPTMFEQAFEKLHGLPSSRLCDTEQSWNTIFSGEGAQDAGGPFREALSGMCNELQDPESGLNLFIPCPNAKHLVGQNRERFIPNPSAKSPRALAMFEFVGKLMGMAIRTKNHLELDLPSAVWKPLCGYPVERGDIEAIDQLVFQSLDALTTIETQGVTEDTFDDVITETFATRGSDGKEVELRPGGADEAVTWANRGDFALLVEHYRINEFQRQVKAIGRGLGEIVPTQMLMLFTWHELELKVCGNPGVDLALLKENTVYLGLSPEDRHVIDFWAVLEGFTTPQRRMFLRFVWGRSRLPSTSLEFTQKFQLQAFNKGQDQDPDAYLPTAHTCFFALELPAYSTRDVMKEKLLYAIANCRAIDTDFNPRDDDYNDYSDDEQVERGHQGGGGGGGCVIS